MGESGVCLCSALFFLVVKGKLRHVSARAP